LTIGTTLYDCNFKKKTNEIITRFDTINAEDGCSMMRLKYGSHCLCRNDNAFSGSASYLISNLSKPLSVGKFYKVTYWMYYSEKQNPSQDPSVLDNLGFVLTNKIIQNIDNC
jgi:hypothetical protein